MEDKGPFILQGKTGKWLWFLPSWWPGDVRSQGISRYVIELDIFQFMHQKGKVPIDHCKCVIVYDKFPDWWNLLKWWLMAFLHQKQPSYHNLLIWGWLTPRLYRTRSLAPIFHMLVTWSVPRPYLNQCCQWNPQPEMQTICHKITLFCKICILSSLIILKFDRCLDIPAAKQLPISKVKWYFKQGYNCGYSTKWDVIIKHTLSCLKQSSAESCFNIK